MNTTPGDNEYDAPCKDRPKDGKVGLGTKKVSGKRASGREKKECVYRGKYVSSLMMPWLWGPLVSTMTLGSVCRAGLSDCGVHAAKSLGTPHRDMTSVNGTASRPLRKRRSNLCPV